MRKLILAFMLCLAAAPAGAVIISEKTDPLWDYVPSDNPPKDEAPVPTDQPPVAPTSKPALKEPLKKPDITDAPAKPAELSAQDTNDVARITTYLNELRSISADFMQVDDRGNISRGAIAIQRPGKMRVTYAPPSHDFIVADGSFVHIWDGSIKSQTNVPQGSSLADFILRDKIILNGDVTVTTFAHLPAKIEVTLVKTDDPGSGELTLIFEDHPLLLRQWRVIDAEGRTTGVNLENERMDVKFDHDTFTFVPPSFGKSPQAR
jgi:outer membrane lipoprotein-sorting protein